MNSLYVFQWIVGVNFVYNIESHQSKKFFISPICNKILHVKVLPWFPQNIFHIIIGFIVSKKIFAVLTFIHNISLQLLEAKSKQRDILRNTYDWNSSPCMRHRGRPASTSSASLNKHHAQRDEPQWQHWHSSLLINKCICHNKLVEVETGKRKVIYHLIQLAVHSHKGNYAPIRAR